MIVTVGKGAIVGAGAVLALLGALDIAFAIAAQDFLRALKPHYLDLATLGGGVIGAVVSAILNR